MISLSVGDGVVGRVVGDRGDRRLVREIGVASAGGDCGEGRLVLDEVDLGVIRLGPIALDLRGGDGRFVEQIVVVPGGRYGRQTRSVCFRCQEVVDLAF